MSTRYLFKRGEDPKHVYIRTDALAERVDMIECDVDGRPLDVQPPIPTPSSPGFVGVDLQKKEYVQPGVTEGDALHLEDGDPFAQLRAELLTMRATDIRLRIKTDFSGAKVPAGLSKIALAETYIEMKRAKSA